MCCATRPPIEAPNTAADATPAASSTATASRAIAVIVVLAPPSDSPIPRGSKVMT
jgi:hypothetical protein